MDVAAGRTPWSRSAAASRARQDARLLYKSAQAPCGVGGGLLQREQESLRGLVIDDVAGALGERPLSLTTCRLAYELAQRLAVGRGLLEATLLLGDPDLDPAGLRGGVRRHFHSVRHLSGQLARRLRRSAQPPIATTPRRTGPATPPR